MAAISAFGAAVKPRLAGQGQPEDQLRGPLETLLQSVASALGLSLVSHGESSLADLKVRPDYAIEINGAVCGYLEVKADGKGADPSAWKRTSHDYRQWEKLRPLPNVLYTDGNEWALYRAGDRVGEVVRLEGNIRTSGSDLATADGALAIILSDFLQWSPTPPRTLNQLVSSVAGLCRILRDEVADALKAEKKTGGAFTRLAGDWRELLFPDATDAQFADGYAQAVTFALLLARVERIDFTGQSVSEVARLLGKEHSLMGKALSILTDDSLGELSLTLDTLVRVVGVVDWARFEKGKRDPYLYLYEHFLEVYDPELRKETGSYYTPVEVVDNMVRLTDSLLRSRLAQPLGFASDQVVVVDPAMGTGAYLLSIIERAADAIAREEGDGAVGPRLRKMAQRLIGFEKQAGPYAVAELRGYEALRRHNAELPADGLRIYVADTLDDPYGEEAHIFAGMEPIARSRRLANKVKREEPVMVVIGNPPYKDKAKDLGGWIEGGNPKANQPPPLDAFRAPGNGKYEKTLLNLYAYFWRWATWKVFDPASPAGVIAFITPSGYLSGPGFLGMREYMRRQADEGWIIDLTPEGHQPPVNTRVFPGVQQPLAIAVFARYGAARPDIPATVHYRTVEGTRRDKFDRLAEIDLFGGDWGQAPTEWGAPFLANDRPGWGSMPALGDLMPWRTGGVHQQRTWVNSPDQDSLRQRWVAFVTAESADRARLLKETRSRKVTSNVAPLGGGDVPLPMSEETSHDVPIVRYAFRSFDRQWLIADSRVIDMPGPDLWRVRGDNQVWVTESHAESIDSGPGVAFSAYIPNLDHYHGRGGRVLPLYRDPVSSVPNLAPGLLQHLSSVLGVTTTPEDFLAYVAAVTAHPRYAETFREDLSVPGVRVPLTSSYDLWDKAVRVGREVLWLHAYGERFTDPSSGRSASPPRLPEDRRPKVIVGIPQTEDGMPDEMRYEAESQTLAVGNGLIGPVPERVWLYDVNGMRVLRKWFGYRKKNAAGRKSSPLDDVRPKTWSPDATTELLNLLNVLGGLVALEERQADLLAQVVVAPQVTVADLMSAGVFPVPEEVRKLSKLTPSVDEAPGLF
ncbi:MAG: hypothetical protein QOC93_397 [Actinomycetota bacterium]|jgi:hypothetical protein|nr:hypothetical protein [Actinomycetota bacterium]